MIHLIQPVFPEHQLWANTMFNAEVEKELQYETLPFKGSSIFSKDLSPIMCPVLCWEWQILNDYGIVSIAKGLIN